MDKNGKNFILDIVPLTKIPLSREQCFCYLSDKKLAPGSLVYITFAKRKIEGIVVGSRDNFSRSGNIELKKINSVIEENFLTGEQMKLAQFISDYYISPLGVVMKNFVPKRVKSRKYLVSSISYLVSKKIKLTKEQLEAVNKIIEKNTKYQILNTRYLLFGPAGSGKTEVYINAIAKIKAQNAKFQFLILLPEKTLTPQALERYGAHFKSEEIVLLSSNVSKGQFYTNWQKIKFGEAKIIIGTRMAIFAPFKKLGLIVIDEEQDMSYKQWDMNPRYDARICAEKLAEMYKCPIVRGSATPSVESYYKAINKQYKLLELPLLNMARSSTSIMEVELPRNNVIVDMRKERWSKNYSCISKKLKSEIEYALKYKQQVILFINRQGMSAFSICEVCKTVLKCPKCDRALIYDKEGYYKCAHCSYKSGIIPKCAKCGGIVFKNVGLGTQKVEKEIANLFPSAKSIIADSALSRRNNFYEKIYADFSKGEADILIGTQMISKGWDLPRVGLIGIIDADNLLSFPDFFAEERAFQNLVQVSGRTNRPGAKFKGITIIQTFQPENLTIKLAAERKYETFFEKEIKERKGLALSPFGKLVKLIFQDYNFKKAEIETEKVYEIIKNISGIKVTEPQNSFVPKIRGRFRRQMIIKIKDEIFPTRLKTELKKLGSGWIIDVDPASII